MTGFYYVYILGKTLNYTEIKGWCKKFEQKNGLPIPAANSAGTTTSVITSIGSRPSRADGQFN